jgi:hypothetical protein
MYGNIHPPPPAANVPSTSPRPALGGVARERRRARRWPAAAVRRRGICLVSTNTKLETFEKPVVVDNKNELERILATVEKEDLIEDLVKKVGKDSAWKFYKFSEITFHTFHIYEMNTYQCTLKLI